MQIAKNFLSDIKTFNFNIMQNISDLEKGMTVEGVVTNITDFGVFVDLGGISGLLHKSKIIDSRGIALYSTGQIIKVVVLKVKDDKVSFQQYIEYENNLFHFNTKELLNYLGFNNTKFIGQAKRTEYLIYFKNLREIDANGQPINGLSNPITKEQISARCGADSICQCPIEQIEEVCLKDSICREQVSLLETIIDGHFYEIELVAGRPEYRQKYNDPFRFSVYRIYTEVFIDENRFHSIKTNKFLIDYIKVLKVFKNRIINKLFYWRFNK